MELLFTTASPINTDKLNKQNRQVYEHLSSGKTITLLIAEDLYGIRHLHSRISDLRNISKIDIKDKMITVIDRLGCKVKCKEYSIPQ